MKKFEIAALGLLLMILAGCSGSGVSPHVRDKKAYALGREHGAAVIAISDNESVLQDRLLDVQARITNINSRLGAQAAADYERGFVDYIVETDDSLARILF